MFNVNLAFVNLFLFLTGEMCVLFKMFSRIDNFSFCTIASIFRCGRRLMITPTINRNTLFSNTKYERLIKQTRKPTADTQISRQPLLMLNTAILCTPQIISVTVQFFRYMLHAPVVLIYTRACIGVFILTYSKRLGWFKHAIHLKKM